MYVSMGRPQVPLRIRIIGTKRRTGAKEYDHIYTKRWSQARLLKKYKKQHLSNNEEFSRYSSKWTHRKQDPREHEGTIQNEVIAYRTLGTYKMNSSKLGHVLLTELVSVGGARRKQDLYDLAFLLFGNAIYSVHERLALHCFFLHFFVFFVTHLENRVLNMSSSRKSHHQLEVREEEAGHLRSGFFRFFCFFLTQQIRFQKIASPDIRRRGFEVNQNSGTGIDIQCTPENVLTSLCRSGTGGASESWTKMHSPTRKRDKTESAECRPTRTRDQNMNHLS